jgi:putative DNA primase/helicase
LAITSATKRCGKSTLVDILNALCSRAVMADSLTAAATFRVMAAARPTLLIDEADTFLENNEELRGILNSGHRATGAVIRAVESNGEWVPRRFSTFGPCAIAMIGRLPGTLEDRALQVVMKRAQRGEVKRSFRPDRAGDLDRLRRQAARFAADHMIALGAAEPELPAGAFNRFADNWRPLAAIADATGGRWPGLARSAILADLGAVEEAELGQQLLEDIRTIFDELVDADAKTRPAQKLASKTIVGALKGMADRP